MSRDVLGAGVNWGIQINHKIAKWQMNCPNVAADDTRYNANILNTSDLWYTASLE